jgi:LEA14-like dessication related protein
MPDGSKRRLTLAALALVTLGMGALSGCSVLPKLEAPKLSVVSMKMQSADIFSQRVQLRMRVLNPNARELPIKGINYRVEVDGAELGQGLAGTPFVVPAMGEAEFDVQFTANLAGALAKLLMRRNSRDSLEYRLVGEVSLSSGFLRRIPFDERGSVKL